MDWIDEMLWDIYILNIKPKKIKKGE